MEDFPSLFHVIRKWFSVRRRIYSGQRDKKCGVLPLFLWQKQFYPFTWLEIWYESEKFWIIHFIFISSLTLFLILFACPFLRKRRRAIIFRYPSLLFPLSVFWLLFMFSKWTSSIIRSSYYLAMASLHSLLLSHNVRFFPSYFLPLIHHRISRRENVERSRGSQLEVHFLFLSHDVSVTF